MDFRPIDCFWRIKPDRETIMAASDRDEISAVIEERQHGS